MPVYVDRRNARLVPAGVGYCEWLLSQALCWNFPVVLERSRVRHELLPFAFFFTLHP